MTLDLPHYPYHFAARSAVPPPLDEYWLQFLHDLEVMRKGAYPAALCLDITLEPNGLSPLYQSQMARDRVAKALEAYRLDPVPEVQIDPDRLHLWVYFQDEPETPAAPEAEPEQPRSVD